MWGGAATEMDSLAVAESPVSGFDTLTVKLSIPSLVLVSVKVPKAVFNAAKVPLKVKEFDVAPLIVRVAGAVAFNRPNVSLISTVKMVLLVVVTDGSTMVKPEILLSRLSAMVLVKIAMVGTLATVMGSMLVDENPEPVSVTFMVKLSAPIVALFSVNVFKAVFTTDKVPFKVNDFVFAPVTFRPVGAVAFNKPLRSLKTTSISVVLVAAV